MPTFSNLTARRRSVFTDANVKSSQLRHIRHHVSLHRHRNANFNTSSLNFHANRYTTPYNSMVSGTNRLLHTTNTINPTSHTNHNHIRHSHTQRIRLDTHTTTSHTRHNPIGVSHRTIHCRIRKRHVPYTVHRIIHTSHMRITNITKIRRLRRANHTRTRNHTNHKTKITRQRRHLQLSNHQHARPSNRIKLPLTNRDTRRVTTRIGMLYTKRRLTRKLNHNQN